VTSSDDKLDPEDWSQFRQTAHRLLDQCIDRMADAASHPWQPTPEATKAKYAIGEAWNDEARLADALAGDVMPYATGNTHPRFFGWVHGTGLPSGLLTEIVAATMNSNCGGRDHGATYVERAVIDWCKSVFGFPETGSGLLVAGTSQATVLALAAARIRSLGIEARKAGAATERLTAYCGGSAHNAIQKAVELLGIGSENLRRIPDAAQGMAVERLQAAIDEDIAAGARPFAIIATAGSVDLGQFDDLNAVSEVARRNGLWLHVDGAFGAWLRIADPRLRSLTDGIEQADSIACDFHKWMYVPYDCGLVLMRSEKDHRAAFAARPSYLEGHGQGLAGGDPWYCDYGIDLSRGNRALKVWGALQNYGPERLGRAISRNCALARLMGERVEATDGMALYAPVVSNLCVFTADKRLSADAQSRLNKQISEDLQLDGTAVFSTTTFADTTYLRAAITNFRTTEDDIAIAVEGVLRAREKLGGA
jgi:aromatic-L-amino-acid decarboxylase